MSLMALLKMMPQRNVKHIWYDFHGETHGDKFYKINDLMNEIRDVQSKFGFFVKERNAN